MNRLILFLIFFSLFTSMCTKIETYDWEDGRWIDLTYDYSDETLYWPASSTFKMDNVANLDQMPPYGAYIIALPMKIKDGSGAPLRIVAHIRE